MSLLTNEIPSDNETMSIIENNKRKFDELDTVLKRFKVDSPTSTFSDEQSNSILNDVTDNESTNDSTDKPIVFPTTISTDCDNDEKINESTEAIVCPKYGQIVNRREFRRAGPYIIGLKLGHSPVDSIVQYLAKKENTDQFVQLKILMLNNNVSNEKMQRDERQGKMLLHTEFSLLSLLKNEPGVIQQHGLFSDMAHEEILAENGSNNNYFTGALRKRLILVLDCVSPHDLDPQSSAYVNLQQYIINRKKPNEMEMLSIFYEIVTVVERLHKRNIIHRDLKLGNIVLNKQTNKITITNFCLGKYLLNENDLLYDQRGSPAYISPDVLCGKPYKGKPSDMWALGVVLFMMLYRQFPFFESTPTALFKKIKSAEYAIPPNSEVSKGTEHIIKGLLQLNPEKRLTATQVREQLKVILFPCNTDHLVPEMSMNTNDSSYQSTVPETPYKEKWNKTYSYSACDQVVPTMSSNSAPAPPSLSRKRPRSTDTLLSEIAQRGISVQHVASDARQLNASDLGQFQHLFRSSRQRLGDLSLRQSLRTSIPRSPIIQNGTDRNQSSPLSAFFRNLPTVRIQTNDASGINRNLSQNPTRLDASQQQTNGSTNMAPNWQFIRFNNTTLSELYRCAVASRGQQSTDASRQSDQARIMRRLRRSRSTTNNQSGR